MEAFQISRLSFQYWRPDLRGLWGREIGWAYRCFVVLTVKWLPYYRVATVGAFYNRGWGEFFLEWFGGILE
nr:hypothetical protein [Desulfobacterales bacterium]